MNIIKDETKEVEISTGIVKMRKPRAGARNKATIKGEFPSPDSPSGSFIKFSVVYTELLPSAIVMPSPGLNDTVPVKDQLDGLDTKDYDILQSALREFYKDETEMQKNISGESSGQSQAKSSPQTSGSETSSSSTPSVKNSVPAPKK